MLNKVKEILQIYAVCRKYGIKLRFWLRGNLGRASVRWYIEDDCLKLESETIKISLFCPDFLDTFYHELGHIRDWRKMLRVGVRPRQTDTSERMAEEISAWEFAKRVRKSAFNISGAIECLNSYSGYHYMRLHPEEIAGYTNIYSSGTSSLQKRIR